MYTIKRKGGMPNALKSKLFKTYEQARKAIRAWLYAQFKLKRVRRTTTDTTNRTATIGNYGFSISKAA
jgi:hypothetical protein